MDEFNTENEVGEDIEYNDASSDEQESESEHFCENLRKRRNAVDKCADKVVEDAENKKKFVAKPHKKISVARSQLQAMSQLAASVNRLAKVNARKTMIEEKDANLCWIFEGKKQKKRENTKSTWPSFT